MRVVVRELRLENFRRLRSVHLDFKPGVFLVEGRNLDENFDSNGSGKSSIFYGLSWVLFGKYVSPDGKVVRGSVVNKEIDHDCSGLVRLDAGGVDYEVKRFNKHREFGNGFFCSPQKRNVVGCSFESFNSLTLFQGGGDLFYGSRQKRRDFLCGLFSIDAFVAKIKKNSRRHRKFFHEELNSLKLVKETCVAELKVLSEHAESRVRFLKVIEENIESLKRELSQKTAELRGLKGQYSELKSREKNLPQFEKRLSELEQQIRELSSQIIDTSELNRKQNVLQYERRQLEGVIANLTDLASESRCPTCLRPIDGSELESLVLQYKEKKLQVEKKYESLVSKLNELENSNNLIRGEIEQLQSEYQKLNEEKRLAVERLEFELREVRRHFENGVQEVKRLQRRIEQLQNERRESQREVDRDLTRRIKRRRNVLGSIDSDLDCLSFLANGYDWWFNAIGSDFVQFALGNFYKEIGKRTTVLLKRIWGEDIAVDLDENGVEIIIRGRKFKLQELSTGEQKRVFLAVALASNLVARDFSGWTCNLMVFDEVFDGLDSRGRNDLILMVRELVTAGYSVFVVTHHVDFDINKFDGVFTVVRENGVSTVERRF